MTRLARYLLCALLLAEAGCTTLGTAPPEPNPPLQSLYDSRILDASGRPQTLAEAAALLAGADVVILGEFHGHPGAHLLQSQLQQALYRLRPNQILTLEQFAIDRQPALDRYLRGDSGEREMMEDAAAWGNYQAAYRPLVEFAIAHDLPVVAANAPAEVVRCVGRQGAGYLDTLPADVRTTLPDQPLLGSAAYRDKFFATMAGGRHGDGDQTRLTNSYQAQLLRDNTMASRILRAHQQQPEAQVVHLTGTFHSEQRLGTVQALQQRAPELTIAVVSPVFTASDGTLAEPNEQLDKGDLIYLLQPLPIAFKDPQRQLQQLQRQFGNTPPTDCAPAP